MVHPGIVVAGVLGVVVTGLVIYTILKEEIDDFIDSFEKPSLVGARGGGRHQQQQQRDQQSGGQQRRFSHDHFEEQGGQSSSMYQPDYELRHRRQRPNDDDDEKEPDVSSAPPLLPSLFISWDSICNNLLAWFPCVEKSITVWIGGVRTLMVSCWTDEPRFNDEESLFRFHPCKCSNSSKANEP